MSFYRLVIAVVMVAALVLTLSWLQGRYDASDHRKSLELVKTYRAKPEGPTIPDVIMKRHPEAKDHDLRWYSELTSGCLGIVRVTVVVPKPPAPVEKTYAFDVRLTDPSIHPTDPTTIEILKALTSSVAN